MKGLIREMAAMDLSQTALIGCEESGIVRRAMAARGIDVWSCDMLPAADGSNKHIQADLRDLLHLPFGLLAVFHPPCTTFCLSGRRWFWIGGKSCNPPDLQRHAEFREAVTFYRACRDAAAERKALENPVMHGEAIRATGRPPVKFVQPWHFGTPAFKATGFELIGLPDLRPTNPLTPPAKGTTEHAEWSKVHRMPPGPDRAKLRSRTDANMAEAIADQWGRFLIADQERIAA